MGGYRIQTSGDRFAIVKDRAPVFTPGGRMFITSIKEIADLVCQDLERYGPHPKDSLSYVTLHASYTDFGSDIPKSDLIQSAMVGYTADWDIALAKLSAFDSSWQSGGELLQNEGEGIAIDPMMWFGPPEDPLFVSTWLGRLHVRAICSLQCFGAACQSVHVAYRLLRDKESFPISLLAKGLIACSECMHPFFGPSGADSTVDEATVVGFLEKVRTYAFFPDELIED